MGLIPDGTVKPPPRSDVGLASDDRGQAMLPGGVIELHGPVHDPVIGQGNGGRAILGRATAQPINSAGPVKQRILGMNVKVDEIFHF